MRISVILDENGNVLGTAPLRSTEDEPTVQLIASEGQTIREIELPAELAETRSAQDLHEALERQLR